MKVESMVALMAVLSVDWTVGSSVGPKVVKLADDWVEMMVVKLAAVLAAGLADL